VLLLLLLLLLLLFTPVSLSTVGSEGTRTPEIQGSLYRCGLPSRLRRFLFPPVPLTLLYAQRAR
jgi:hypothetical protein